MDHILDLEKPAGLDYTSASRGACRRFYASVVCPLFKNVKPMQAGHISFLLPSLPRGEMRAASWKPSAQSQQTVSKRKSGIGDFMAPRFRSWFPLAAVLLLESSRRLKLPARFPGETSSRKQHQVCSSSGGAHQQGRRSATAVWPFGTVAHRPFADRVD